MKSNEPHKVLELQEDPQKTYEPLPTSINHIPTTNSHPDLEIPINQKLSPYRSNIEKANLFSLLHFFFGIKLIHKVNSIKGRPLRIQDLEPPGETESCENLEKSFTKYYKEYSKKWPGKRRVFTFTLFQIFKKNILIQAFWQILYAFGRLMVAYFIFRIIYAFKNYANPVHSAYLAMIGYSLSTIIAFYANNQYNFNAAYTVNRMRIGWLGMMFRKINKLSIQSLNVINLGKVINISANDLNNLDRIYFSVSLLIAPIIFGAGIGLLWYFWGVSCLVGIGYMMAMWMIQWPLAYKTSVLRRTKSTHTDERDKTIEESLSGIRLVKMYAWENNWMDLVKQVRTKEIWTIKKFNFIDSVSRAFTYSSHWVAAFLIFVVYTEIDTHIIPSKTFATILVLTLLRQTVEINIFNCFLMFIEMKFLFSRTMTIMVLPEISANETKKPLPLDPANSIEFEDFTAFWQEEDKGNEKTPPPVVNQGRAQNQAESAPPALSNVNLDIKKGSLNIIIGKLASGKSSLLYSLTGEIPKYTGALRYQGSYAYVAQNPVLFYGPLKDSIIFGKAYNEELFWRVLDACCLTEDVKKLPEKEMSEIGERGTILTGSQKVRLILARALYAEADIYLMDDPLIGLDAKLAKKIFKNAVLGFLKEKTVLLITHRFPFLKYADNVILMDKGKVVTEGTYKELKKREIFGEHKPGWNEEKLMETMMAVQESPQKLKREESKFASIWQKEEEEEAAEETTSALRKELAAPGLDEGLFIEEEKLDDGKVTLKSYGSYFKSIFTWYNFVPLVILFFGAEAITWLFMIMVGKWGRAEYSNKAGMIVLGCLAAGGFLLHLCKFFLYFNSTLNAAHKLHNRMLRGVFLSSIKFFDKNSVGRIICRFSNDTGILDKFLIGALIDFLEGFCLFIVFLVTLWVTEPYILIPAAIGALVYIIVYLWARKTLNQTRGLELTTRAPLYSLFLIEVEGLATMRARGQTEDMMKVFFSKANDHSKANISYLVSVRIMTFIINYAVELIVIATFCVFIPVNNTPLNHGYFVNILTLMPTTMQWILQSFILLNLIMSSVARVISFCENHDHKELLAMEKKKSQNVIIKKDWPKTGEIEVQNANMRYTNKSERYLKNLSFHIKSGEKVAVVCGSRTGISHIVSLLLRMFEIDKVMEGVEPSFVKIDGVNIKDVDQERLRKELLVIPQNAYIWPGTIRRNLDPWNLHTDEEIWNVLEKVKLKEYIESLKEKLKTNLSRDQSVFSWGQKHLLAIARAMLRGGKIVIQDEATTHVDLSTNHAVQKSIVSMYKESTLITITHRLYDIAKYDKVLLIQDGVKVEFDEPYRLLVLEIGDTEITNRKGAFASLVRSLGSEFSRQMMRRCRKHYYKKHGLVLEDVMVNVEKEKVLDEEDNVVD